MRIHVTAIKNTFLRRAAMLALPIALYPLMLVLGAIRGALDLTDSLFGSWGPAWDGVPGPLPHAQVGVRQGMLMIHIPIDLVAFAAEHGPFQHSVVDPDTVKPEDRFRVYDPVVFGESVARELLREQGEDGGTLVHQMIDDAIEQVVDSGELGFVWPAAGIGLTE